MDISNILKTTCIYYLSNNPRAKSVQNVAVPGRNQTLFRCIFGRITAFEVECRTSVTGRAHTRCV